MDIKFVFAQGVLAGKSSASEKKCLEDQLRDAKAAVRDAESGLKQLATKIKHFEKELKEKKALLVSKRDEAIAAENELKTRTKDLDGIKAGGATAQASRRIDMTPH